MRAPRHNRSAPSPAPGRGRAVWHVKTMLTAIVLATGLPTPGDLRAEEAKARTISESQAPARVVSMNLCTDQLAMLVAAPGQIVALSRLSRDPKSSAMAEQAHQYPSHASGAEEVFWLKPDLVLAGTYTARPAIRMLQRLGTRVETFPIEERLDQIPEHLRRMGALLGQQERAEALIAEFEAGLEEIRKASTKGAGTQGAEGPRVALYGAGGYSAGTQSLTHEIVTAAGLRNVAVELGRPYGGYLHLEELAVVAPDLVLAGTRYPGHSRAEEIVQHPVVQAHDLRRLTGADWVCGLPQVVGAIQRLREAVQ